MFQTKASLVLEYISRSVVCQTREETLPLYSQLMSPHVEQSTVSFSIAYFKKGMNNLESPGEQDE